MASRAMHRVHRRRMMLAASGLMLCALSHRAVADAQGDFFKAIELDRPRMLRPLLDDGFDANTLDPSGQVGLFIALRDGALNAAEVLFAHKATDIDRANEAGETPLMMAALRGHLDWVRRFLDRGVAPERSGWAPLHYAASGPEPKVLALLLERGARVDALSSNGTTPLMMAAGYGALDGAALLLARGADRSVRNAKGLTAADFARRAGRELLAGQLATGVR